jgi:hypothetical protein
MELPAAAYSTKAPLSLGSMGRDFKTFLKFHVDNGKITKIAVGQISY